MGVENMERTACFTGHRPKAWMRYLPGEARCDQLRGLLDRTIALLCQKEGVRVFLCGMANGFDLFAGQRVLALRREGAIPEDVRLVAVQPYPQHLWDVEGVRWKRAYQEVLQGAQDQCVVSSEKRSGVFRRRNAFMVRYARYVVAYWDHSWRSGTGQTVRMAESRGRIIVNLYDLQDHPGGL